MTIFGEPPMDSLFKDDISSRRLLLWDWFFGFGPAEVRPKRQPVCRRGESGASGGGMQRPVAPCHKRGSRLQDGSRVTC